MLVCGVCEQGACNLAWVYMVHELHRTVLVQPPVPQLPSQNNEYLRAYNHTPEALDNKHSVQQNQVEHSGAQDNYRGAAQLVP